MAEEISYVIVTPYSIRKARTGGILARLISRTGLEVVAARMFAPSAELVEKYAAMIVNDPEPRHRATQELIRKYVLANFSPRNGAVPPRVLLLVFKGENAVNTLRSTVGPIPIPTAGCSTKPSPSPPARTSRRRSCSSSRTTFASPTRGPAA